jgi:hypothetical protein
MFSLVPTHDKTKRVACPWMLTSFVQQLMTEQQAVLASVEEACIPLWQLETTETYSIARATEDFLVKDTPRAEHTCTWAASALLTDFCNAVAMSSISWYQSETGVTLVAPTVANRTSYDMNSHSTDAGPRE